MKLNVDTLDADTLDKSRISGGLRVEFLDSVSLGALSAIDSRRFQAHHTVYRKLIIGHRAKHVLT